jgi:hypothetical protein
MPWEETDEMTERMLMMTDYLSGNFEVTELCWNYGVSRPTFYKWKERFEVGGPEALKDQSRARHEQGDAVAEWVVGRILGLKAKWPRWGAPKILTKLKEEIPQSECPCEGTVGNILKRYG